MKFAEITGWVEDHPTESIVIGAGGLIAILWLLGYFGSSSSASSSGASSLASAYYAAEAQQATVGGEIQMNNSNNATQAAVAATQANAAVAINAAQYGAATTINGQNASTTAQLGDDQLLATYSSNAAAVATNQSNNDAAVSMNNTNNLTQQLATVYPILAPTELANVGGAAWSFMLPSSGGQSITGGGVNAPAYGTPDYAKAAGYTSYPTTTTTLQGI